MSERLVTEADGSAMVRALFEQDDDCVHNLAPLVDLVDSIVRREVAKVERRIEAADHVVDALVERAQRIGMSFRVADPAKYNGWTREQWVADAIAIMDSPDGSCAELVNGHVNALIAAIESGGQS